jgi:hypothetical protein
VRRTSWHSHHQRGGQEQLQPQGSNPQENQGTGCLVVAGVPGHLDRRLFQGVDLSKDAAERLAILRSEVAPSGLLGDLLQQRLVDSNRQQLVAKAAQAPPRRNGCLTDGPDPDGVDLDAER